MKLKIQNWKAAWFDAHINDRFFQEMSRIEKVMVKDLETSAQWMEQVMIEVGQLAQSMIRLENNETPEPQIRQAMEKSLRLAALSLQLVVTIDGLDREMLKSSQRQYATPNLPKQAFEFTAAATASAVSSPRPLVPVPPSFPSQTAGGIPGNGPLPGFLQRQMQTPAASRTDPGSKHGTMAPPIPEEDATGNEDTAKGSFPTLSPFLDFSPDRSEAATSRMHDTIASLSQQGLSRAEIEAVTGEPRHIIEAVINHSQGL